MQKEFVLQLLREKGYRLTKQREMLLDIMLGGIAPAVKKYITRRRP